MVYGCKDSFNNPTSSIGVSKVTQDTTENIIEIVKSDDGFSELVSTLQSIGFDYTLQEAGPFTLFASTNKAFASLPDGLVEN